MLLTLIQVISNNVTLEAAVAHFTFSIYPPSPLLSVFAPRCRALASPWQSCAALCSTCSCSAKGQTDKEAEAIICVSSRGSAQQSSIMEPLCDVGAFHRSHKRLEIIEIPLIALPLLAILIYCSECEISVQRTCKTKQLLCCCTLRALGKYNLMNLKEWLTQTHVDQLLLTFNYCRTCSACNEPVVFVRTKELFGFHKSSMVFENIVINVHYNRSSVFIVLQLCFKVIYSPCRFAQFRFSQLKCLKCELQLISCTLHSLNKSMKRFHLEPTERHKRHANLVAFV